VPQNSWLTYLKEHEGALSFVMDVWSSLNYKAFMAITMHFKNNGIPICMLLDIVKVAKSHLGANLGAAFAQILHDFGISEKVSI